MTYTQILAANKLENQILDIIDNANDMTRSDVQGAVSALVKNWLNAK